MIIHPVFYYSYIGKCKRSSILFLIHLRLCRLPIGIIRRLRSEAAQTLTVDDRQTIPRELHQPDRLQLEMVGKCASPPPPPAIVVVERQASWVSEEASTNQKKQISSSLISNPRCIYLGIHPSIHLSVYPPTKSVCATAANSI